jgi:hypothetical protein
LTRLFDLKNFARLGERLEFRTLTGKPTFPPDGRAMWVSGPAGSLGLNELTPWADEEGLRRLKELVDKAQEWLAVEVLDEFREPPLNR